MYISIPITIISVEVDSIVTCPPNLGNGNEVCFQFYVYLYASTLAPLGLHHNMLSWIYFQMIPSRLFASPFRHNIILDQINN